MPPKFTHYELKLAAMTDDGAKVINFITRFLPASYATIAEANASRRAIATLFGGAVTCDVFSFRRIPARTVRRKLKL